MLKIWGRLSSINVRKVVFAAQELGLAFERIDVGRPEAPERRQPGVDLHERLGPEPIDAPLGFDARLHEAGLAQHAEVLGHRSLRHPQPALDLADGALRRRQQTEDGPAVRLREDRER